MKNEFEIDGDVTTIFIRRKNGECLRVLIDTEDLEKVSGISSSWHLSTSKENHYAVSYTYKNRRVDKCLLMHRLIMDAPVGYEVDHVNHKTLDNRKSELRIVTTSENAQNKKNLRTDSSSKITGVSWNKRKNKWQCYINKDKKRVSLGYYKDIEDAEKVVKEARVRLFHFSKEYTESTGIVSKNTDKLLSP